ncbi:MAG: aldo/keto reductase [Candidatus Krumholzibacteriota bacterium]|nr:aldo/keto reductase [Candidatus Krumholzibacteriota bacterium]
MQEKSGDISRRGFISTALSGIVGASVLAVAPQAVSADKKGEKAEKKAEEKSGKILYRRLGKTDIEIPVVSMGVMNSENPSLVRASYELGIRHFDTAAYYQGGKNERMVGEVIKSLGVRDKVTIATKIYTPNMREGDTPEITRKKILKQIDESLERLQLDYVDILYVHNVDSGDLVRDEAVQGAMKEIQKMGKTRYTGVSTHRNLHEVINAVVETGTYQVVLTVINFTMGDYTELFSAIEKAADQGIGIIAMKTQAGSSRRSRLEISDEFSSSTIATSSLKWVLRNKNITTAIPGYTTFEHMKEDFSVAFGLDYDQQEQKLLQECNVKLGMGFCRQCGVCVNTCPRGVDIPTLMRTHMYAARYANFEHARVTLREIPEAVGLACCSRCEECSARCAHLVDIARGIGELKLIYC